MQTLSDVAGSFVSASEGGPYLPSGPEAPPALPGHILEQLARTQFQQGRWKDAWANFVAAIKSADATVDISACLLMGGRCAIHLAKHGVAQEVLSAYVEHYPTDSEGLFYLGRAYQGSHRDLDALNSFAAADLLNPNRPKYLAALAQTAHSLAFAGFGFSDQMRAGTYISIASAALQRALAKDENHFDSLNEKMLLSLDIGDIDAALDVVRQMAKKEKVHGLQKVRTAASNLALALARSGRDERIPEVEYLAKYATGRRILSRAQQLATPVVVEQPPSEQESRLLVADANSGRYLLQAASAGRLSFLKRGEVVSSPAGSISVDCAFVVPVLRDSRPLLTKETARLARLPEHFAGLVAFRKGAPIGAKDLASVRLLILRKEAWNELVAANPSFSFDEIAQYALERLDLFVVSQTEPIKATALLTLPRQSRPRVLVLSRHGPRLVGGGEQFLRIASSFYVERGAEVLFAGLTRDAGDALDDWPADARPVSSGFIYEEPADLRAFVLKAKIDAIHVISGLGEFVLDACSGLNVKLIYGVHFWREFIAGDIPSRPVYPNVRLDNVRPVRIMNELMARADFLYVNSDFCADIVRTVYSGQPPIIYSVPLEEEDDAEADLVVNWPKDFVLLANARADKGWHLLLDIAERLPHRAFVAIASQSDSAAALSDVHRRGLHNVTVMDRVGRMSEVYRAARLVVVPSFAFVETFSRVVIEAGRLSRPVLMADSGNLTYLGKGTDLVLDNDPETWSRRVEEILASPDAWNAAVEASKGIADQYSAQSLRKRIANVPLPSLTPRVLVCVGSGVGNTCHTTPMIRALARAIGSPVDVLVAGDFGGTSAAMDGADAVSQVFEDFEHVASRRYDLVLVTHCFGSVVPGFNADYVISSRDLDEFDPAGDIHESTFNLHFLARATGIVASEQDAVDYFFGAIGRDISTGRKVPRIGLHAGSKGGVWSTKRWPGFARLAIELARKGAEVVSVGIPEEYVEGTLDRTGLTIARMAEEIAGCDAVVSNDSGVMNVANAMGVPLVVLFGPTNPKTRGPIKSPARVIGPGTACAPCEGSFDWRHRFDSGTCRCISLISVADAMNALRSLGVLPPDTGSRVAV